MPERSYRSGDFFEKIVKKRIKISRKLYKFGKKYYNNRKTSIGVLCKRKRKNNG